VRFEGFESGGSGRGVEVGGEKLVGGGGLGGGVFGEVLEDEGEGSDDVATATANF
jgi:hypothetical protein